MFMPASTTLSEHVKNGIDAFNKDLWIPSANAWLAAKKLTQHFGEFEIYSRLQELSEDNIHNRPHRPMDTSMQCEIARLGIILPALRCTP